METIYSRDSKKNKNLIDNMMGHQLTENTYETIMLK
jgi:hypothetical protein